MTLEIRGDDFISSTSYSQKSIFSGLHAVVFFIFGKPLPTFTHGGSPWVWQIFKNLSSMSSDDVVAFEYFDTSCIIPYCFASRNRELSFEYDILYI